MSFPRFFPVFQFKHHTVLPKEKILPNKSFFYSKNFRHFSQKIFLPNNVSTIYVNPKHVRIRTITFSFFILKVEVFYFSFQNLSISDYENEAIEILDVCNSVDKETAGDLVNTRLPQYGKRTLMELAALSKRQKFISHNRCKIEVDKIWRNKIVIQDGELLNIMVINRFEIVDGF